LVVKPSLPRNKKGLIDGNRLLYIATVRLNLSYDALDTFTPGELLEMNEYYLEDQRDYLEFTALAVATGYASAKKGRHIKMFKEQKENDNGRITQEKKKSDMDYLKGLF
jgi:hypothetical protein